MRESAGSAVRAPESAALHFAASACRRRRRREIPSRAHAPANPVDSSMNGISKRLAAALVLSTVALAGCFVVPVNP